MTPHPKNSIYNSLTKKWYENEPHLDKYGTCLCDCEVCSTGGDEENSCICPDCNAEACEIHAIKEE